MKIRYITSHGIADMVEFDPEDDGFIRLELDRHTRGALTLGGTVYTLTEGEASVPVAALRDGEYAPRFETEDGIFTADSFTKSGSEIIPRKADESLIRRLLSGYARLKKKFDLLEERVGELEKTCRGHDIFKFETERKEQ